MNYTSRLYHNNNIKMVQHTQYTKWFFSMTSFYKQEINRLDLFENRLVFVLSNLNQAKRIENSIIGKLSVFCVRVTLHR